MLSYIKNLYTTKRPIEDSFTWQYMDLDSELVEEIKSIYFKILPENLNTLNFFNQKDISIPDIFGFKVTCASLIYTNGNLARKYAHKDPIIHSTLALNIPLVNCESSVTTLYKDSKHAICINHRHELIDLLPVDKGEILSTYILDRPILFNTRFFHAVKNNSPEPRLAISLRFDRNPTEWILKK